MIFQVVSMCRWSVKFILIERCTMFILKNWLRTVVICQEFAGDMAAICSRDGIECGGSTMEWLKLDTNFLIHSFMHDSRCIF